MTPETFCEQFATFAEAPNGVAKLRELILQLAVQGKLGTQDVNDEPADELLRRIALAKAEMVRCKTIAARDSQPIGDEEIPFVVPDSWRWCRLCDIAHDLGQRTPEERFTYIDVGAINKERGVVSDNVQVLEANEAPSRARKIVAFNSVIYSTVRPYLLNVAVIETEFTPTPIVSTAFAVLHPHDGMDSRFIYHYLRSKPFVTYVESEMTGIAYPAINDGKMYRGLIPVPPLAEQRRIVGKVDQLLGLCDELAARQAARREARSALVGATLDRLVSARSAAEFPAHAHRLRDHFDRLFDTPTTLPQLRQAILQLAVQGQLVPQDPNDEPAAELLERARMERVDTSDDGEALDEAMDSTNESDDLQLEQPASWKLVRFADIISYGPRNGISPKPVQHVTKTKSLTLSATTSGTFDGRHVKYLTEEFPADSFLWLKDGDILIQRSNSEHYVGVAAIYRGEPNDFVYPDLMMKVRVASCIDVAFAHLILMSPPSRAYFRTRATGTSGSMRKINKTTVKTLPFPLPPLSEQKRIVSKVTELLSLCDALEAKLTQAESASTQLLSAAVHHLLLTSP